MLPPVSLLAEALYTSSKSQQARRILALLWKIMKYNLYVFILKVLAAGPMPNHVAFIMDGNRRHARKNGKPVVQGHVEGSEALREASVLYCIRRHAMIAKRLWQKKMLTLCLFLNIKCISAYMFSIENFNRDKEEVSALMNIVCEKLTEATQQGEFLQKFNVRLNLIGNRRLLPEFVQREFQRAEKLTKRNTGAIVNIHVPYTSRDEIATAISSCAQNAAQDVCRIPSITEKDIDAQLMTSQVGSPPLDILVRSSGVKRLSDYMLWQCCEDTQIQFCDANWPEFGMFNFIPMILDYQRKIWKNRKTV